MCVWNLDIYFTITPRQCCRYEEPSLAQQAILDFLIPRNRGVSLRLVGLLIEHHYRL